MLESLSICGNVHLKSGLQCSHLILLPDSYHTHGLLWKSIKSYLTAHKLSFLANFPGRIQKDLSLLARQYFYSFYSFPCGTYCSSILQKHKGIFTIKCRTLFAFTCFNYLLKQLIVFFDDEVRLCRFLAFGQAPTTSPSYLIHRQMNSLDLISHYPFFRPDNINYEYSTWLAFLVP